MPSRFRISRRWSSRAGSCCSSRREQCPNNCYGWYRGSRPWAESHLIPGAPIRIPVGKATLGRIMNVIGEPIDERGPINGVKLSPIHAEPPPFVEQSTTAEVLGNWHQGRRPSRPLCSWWQNRTFRRCWCRKDCVDPGIDQQCCQGPRWFLYLLR